MTIYQDDILTIVMICHILIVSNEHRSESMKYTIIEVIGDNAYVFNNAMYDNEDKADKLCDTLREISNSDVRQYRVVCLPEEKNLEVVND